MNTPFFSIIIPTLNVEKNIIKCVNSILSQDFYSFEIIIQDACSSDNTIKLISALNDNRIKCYSESDDGIYDAMNKAVIKAKGEWIYFMGSDDSFYANNVLTDVFRSVEANIQIIYGNVYSSRFNGIYDEFFTLEKLYSKNICHQAIFYKKELFNHIGLFNLRYNVLADYEHNIRWFMNSTVKRKYIENVICRYSDGGFSSRNEDHEFQSNKDYFFFKFSKEMNENLLFKIYSNILQKFNHRRFKLFFLKMKYFYLKISLRIVLKYSNLNKIFISNES